MLAYRIVSPRYAETSLSGEGARLYGGRWNSPGRRCVYAAESRSLAILEMLVHLSGKARARKWTLLTIEIPDRAIAGKRAAPSPGWDAMPAGEASQSVGDHWLEAAATIAMQVPSVLIPEESNFLLNPAAKDFDEIEVLERRDFQLDLRLF